MTVLLTPRLTLRPYADDDHDAFVTLNTDAEVRAHMDGPLTLEQATRLFATFTDAPYPVFAVVCEGAYVGHAFLAPADDPDTLELGFLFATPWWGRGFATEVGEALLAHAADALSGTAIIATVDLDHAASIRVLEKLGMTRVREYLDDDPPWAEYVVS